MESSDVDQNGIMSLHGELTDFGVYWKGIVRGSWSDWVPSKSFLDDVIQIDHVLTTFHSELLSQSIASFSRLDFIELSAYTAQTFRVSRKVRQNSLSDHLSSLCTCDKEITELINNYFLCKHFGGLHE